MFLEDKLIKMFSDEVLFLQKLNQAIPQEIYIKYDEYFESLENLIEQCKSSHFYTQAKTILLESMNILLECLEEMAQTIDKNFCLCSCCEYEGLFKESSEGEICPNCNSTAYERKIIEFFSTSNMPYAKEGFKVRCVNVNQCVCNWMNYYCPQVDCEIIDDSYSMIDEPDVVVSFKAIPFSDLYEEIVKEDLYIYILHEFSTMDFSHKWNIDKNLCENGPTVSVLMSCYNHQNFVAEAIESVLNQSYKNIEFIICDDASTDKTAEVINRYKSSFSKCILYKENAGGRTGELKQYATGKYIAVMHSDDVWDKDKIALQVEYMENNPDCGVCLSWCRHIDEYGSIMSDQLFIQPNRTQEEWIRFFWENGNALCNPSSLTRREIFNRKLWQGITSRQLPDYFKWIDMVQSFPIHIITKELTFMRRYQLKNLENTSANTGINSLNMHIEMGANWWLCLRDMEDDFFIRSFNKYFKLTNANSKEELLCEKYFLLLSHNSPFVQNSALTFFNDFYVQIKDVMEEKYHYSSQNYREDARAKGLMEFLKGVVY